MNWCESCQMLEGETKEIDGILVCAYCEEEIEFKSEDQDMDR